MKKIVAFDFDGTITSKDSFIVFIIFSRGYFRFLLGFTLHLPLLILYKLHLFNNSKMKEIIFSWFFKGFKLATFNQQCKSFCDKKVNSIVINSARHAIEQYKQDPNTELVIVSASIENWLIDWANEVGFDRVIATKIEVCNGVITGRLLSNNCYGEEKVTRLKEHYPERDKYHLTSYGDSNGDRELLAYSDEGNYKYFK